MFIEVAAKGTPAAESWGLGFCVLDFGFGIRWLGFGVWVLGLEA